MAKAKTKIFGLADWGLSPASLRRLGSRSVKVSIQQRGPDLRRLFPLAPPERRAKLATFLAGGLKRLQRLYPETTFDVRGDSRLAWTIDTELPAKAIIGLSKVSNVASLWIEEVRGRRRLTLPTSEREWFAVRGTVAIQIEDQTSGYQSVEDRVVLVKARSAENAKQRLEKSWQEYAEPYLNPDGFMVRWVLEKVVDVYVLTVDEIEEDGTEVYSHLRQRRMRPEYEWHPRRRQGR